MSYTFINRDVLNRKSKDLTSKIESMYDAYYSFIEGLENLQNNEFISLINLKDRAGLDDKLLKKVTTAVEEYRKLYFDIQMKVMQRNLDEFKEVK